MSASFLLEDRDTVSMKQQVEVIKTATPALVGKTMSETDIRERTGCTVLAVRRGETTVTEIGPNTQIREGDELLVVGADNGVRKFERLFT